MSTLGSLKILDEDAVRRLLSWDELIPAMADALRSLSSGEAVQPVRTIVPVKEHEGFFGVMPAYNGALGAKLVTFYPENKHVHTHHGLIALFRPETGEPLAIMDGRLITEMRTAAVSAVATNLLARDDARVLAIIGSGVQAGSHLEALCRVRRFEEIRVWSPRNAGSFAERHGVNAVESAESAVRGADVLAVVTSAKQPVIRGDWLSAGCHINAVGANRPTWRELDDEVLAASTIFVESRASAAVESGDVIASGKTAVEIGEVISGSRPGRTSEEEITLFKSLGAAVEDIAAAAIVLRNSEKA